MPKLMDTPAVPLLKSVLCIPAHDHQARRVRKGADDDHDKVNKKADAKDAAGQKPYDARTGLADIKPMDSKIAEKNTQQQGNRPVFGETGA